MKDFDRNPVEAGDFLFGPGEDGKNTYHIVAEVSQRGFFTYPYDVRTDKVGKLGYYGETTDFLFVRPELIDEDRYFTLTHAFDGDDEDESE